jgi:hypothetical protein
LGNQGVQHREGRNRDRENHDRRRESSALTCIGFQRSESEKFDHWTREVASYDFSIIKERGNRVKRSVGADFPLWK